MQTYVRFLAGLILYLGAAQFTFLAFIQKPGNPAEYEKGRLVEMVDGTAHRPYVYRTLLPTTVGLIERSLPETAHSAISGMAERSAQLQKLFSATPASEESAFVTYLIAYALEFASLLAFGLTLRAAIRYFYMPSVWLSDLLPPLAMAGVVVFFRYISYDYDLPQLWIFTLGLLLLARKKWIWFYPVLVLGAFNKETVVLLVLVHVLAHWSEMPRRVLVNHAIAQLGIIVLVRCFLQFVVFRENPGGSYEFWFARNWEMILDVEQRGYLFFHFMWVGNTSLVIPTNYNVLFLLLLPLVFWRWSQKPLVLRRGLWMLPVLAALMVPFGMIDETRIFYEVYPVVFLLMAGSICELAKPAVREAAETEGSG